MQYNTLGKTDLKVSRLCLGCMTFGEPQRGNHAWTLPEESSRLIIKHALDGGINFFDCGPRAAGFCPSRRGGGCHQGLLSLRRFN